MEHLLRKALKRAHDRRRLPVPAERKRIREMAGVSQAALAAAVGTSVPAVSRWESGKRAPRDTYLARYLEVLQQLEAKPER
jgi:DNA-binding transcriptional regulator YiaG